MLRKRIASFGYAFKGLATLIVSQPNARIHLLATLLVLSAGSYFDLQRWEWVSIVLAVALVLAAEAVNTALEFLTDLVSPDYHRLAGKAKDVAAAAVLLAAIGAACVGILIFLPYVVALFH